MFLKSSGEAYKLSMSSKPIEKKVLEEEEEEEEIVANLGISIKWRFHKLSIAVVLLHFFTFLKKANISSSKRKTLKYEHS
jgi:hypothetical protein